MTELDELKNGERLFKEALDRMAADLDDSTCQQCRREYGAPYMTERHYKLLICTHRLKLGEPMTEQLKASEARKTSIVMDRDLFYAMQEHILNRNRSRPAGEITQNDWIKEAIQEKLDREKC